MASMALNDTNTLALLSQALTAMTVEAMVSFFSRKQTHFCADRSYLGWTCWIIPSIHS